MSNKRETPGHFLSEAVKDVILSAYSFFFLVVSYFRGDGLWVLFWVVMFVMFLYFLRTDLRKWYDSRPLPQVHIHTERDVQVNQSGRTE